MNPSTTRSTMFAIVGGYLIYMAYELLKSLIDKTPTTMPPWLQITVIVLFTAAGIGLLVFAWKTWRKGREDQDKNPVDLTEQEDAAKSEKDTPEM